ncbi:transposase, partial [Ligilactobacillus aviarius]
WKRKQSGNFESENTKLSQTGNRYFRYYLVEAANSVKNRVPEYKTFYQRKYAETPKHKHKRALVLTARKFVRLVGNHQLYMPPKEAKETE